jgi:hypothetical protein
MNFLKILLTVTITAGILSCNNDDFKVSAKKTVTSGFESSIEEWQASMAEYSSNMLPTDTNFLNLKHSRLPTGLDTTRYALRIFNKIPDVKMFSYIKKQISGLSPGHVYQVSFEISMGTNIAQNSAAGSSIFLKAGASPNEPLTDSKTFSFNLDKGNAGQDGKRMVVLGDISNELNRGGYALVQKTSSGKSVQVEADAEGKIWLCIGTDAAYTGTIVYFYDSIKCTITENQ